MEILNFKTMEILKRVKSPTFEDSLELSMAGGYNDYIHNAHRTNQQDVEGLENFCKMLYTDWYNRMTQNADKFDGIKKDVADSLLRINKFNPEVLAQQKTEHPFYNFLLNDFGRFFNGTGTEMAYFQDGTIVKGKDGINPIGFMHVYGWRNNGQKWEGENARLYLNLQSKNLAKFATEAYKMCKERNLPFYFKFTIQDNKNDPFLFYVNHDNLAEYVDIIHKIREKNPELFEGAEKMNMHLGVLDGFIGYAESPEITDWRGEKHSYNSLRRDAINSVRSQVIQQFRSKFGGQNNQIIVSNPKPMTFREYCDQLSETFAKKKLHTDFVTENEKRLLKQIKDDFYEQYRHMILTGEPIQDVKIEGAHNVNVPFSQKNWFEPFLDNGSLNEVRGILTEFTYLSGKKFNDDEKELIRSVKKNLVSSLNYRLMLPTTSGQDRTEIQRLLSKIDVDPVKLDGEGRGLILVSAANFIENGILSINDGKNNYRFPGASLDVYSDVLGKGKIDALIEQKCKECHISKENMCFNSETEQKISKAESKYRK